MRKPVVVRFCGVRARVRFVGDVCSLMVGSIPGYSDRLLDQKLQAILDQGVPATLPEDIVDYLKQRRAEAMKRGQWVEGHYRPGLRPQIPRKRKGK